MNYRWSSIIAGAGLLAVGSSLPLHGAGDAAAITRSFVEQQMRVSRIPGVALVIVDRGGVAYADAFSLDDRSLSPDSPFLIGSVSKTLTALAIAQLADMGRLHFDDPISSHLPEFVLHSPPGGTTMTLRHLLTHTSGFSQWSGHDRRAQREARFAHLTPVRLPGERFEYSSLNYIILGRVIEAVAGMPYGSYVERHIFGPLNMRSSFTNLESASRNGLVGGHRYMFGLTLAGRESQQPGPLIPAGFLVSSARDLGNVLLMLLNEGTFHGRRIVSPEVIREMLTPWDDAPTGVAMAWGVGRTSINHAGNTPTFSARVSVLTDQTYGIVLLANVNSGPFFSGTSVLMDGVIRILRGERIGTVRPDEILLKVGLLVLVLYGAVRAIINARRWARRGFPRRLIASRRVATPLVREAMAATLVVLVIPRWIGVPLLTLLEYFPDLGLAIILGVVTGFSGALTRSFVAADDSREAAVLDSGRSAH